MSQSFQLTGITWDHTRGYVPLVAAAQRFAEEHGVEIVWQKRSLKAFGDQPLQQLAPHFDLLVIDHPFVGYAAAHNTLLPLDALLPAAFIADQEANSVGASHASYVYDDHLWALAIDAATPVSAWRPDLLERAGVLPPATWEDLVALARRGLVALPAVPIDSLMHFYMLCGGLGEDPFRGDERVVGREVGAAALAQLRELVALCAPACLRRNPINTYEALARGEAVYCPFAYGYSNYARDGYVAHTLCFGGLVQLGAWPLRSTLGGTGLAISATCRQPEVAAAYAQYVASPACQRGMYVCSGGQPGHRSAWQDARVNAACGNFFRDTLPTLDAATLRPRYNGYMRFQDEAAPLVHRYLAEGGDTHATLDELDASYRSSQTGH